ncbi:MAG: GDSL-type esterase/lipase family protein [Sarcina sp.]
MKFSSKKIFILGIILCLILVSLNIIIIQFKQSKNIETLASKDEITNNKKTIEQLGKSDLSKIEKEYSQIQKNLKPDNLITNSDLTNDKKTSINYKDTFSTSVFLGDSQTEGLEVYNILNPTSVVALKGGNLVTAKNSMQTLKNLSPSTVFILYGMNDILIYENDINSFIKDYEILIKEIKNTVPEGKIVVNAILPVNSNVLQNRPIYQNINKYNIELEKLCSALNVPFVNSSSLLSNDKNLFEGDGMHLKPEFYTKWLNILKNYI